MEPEVAELCQDCSTLIHFNSIILEPDGTYSKTRGNVGLVMKTSSTCILCQIMLKALPIERLRTRLPDINEVDYTALPFITKLRNVTASSTNLHIYPRSMWWALLQVTITHKSTWLSFSEILSLTIYDTDRRFPSDVLYGYFRKTKSMPQHWILAQQIGKWHPHQRLIN
jgi:hypothetical protein